MVIRKGFVVVPACGRQALQIRVNSCAMVSWTKLISQDSNWINEDSLRYSKDTHGVPKIVVWNITSSCNLNCRHCYFDAGLEPKLDELTNEQAKSFIKDLSEIKVPVLLFSGGEPLLREDIFKLAEFAKHNRIRPVLSTNGTLITKRIAKKIKQSGFSYVGISIDGIEQTNDWFRQKKGAFAESLTGIRNCKREGLKVGIRFTLNRYNFKDLYNIFNLIEEEGISRFCIYHIVYTGRGSNLIDSDLGPDEKRKFLNMVWEKTVQFSREDRHIEVLTVDNHADGVWFYLRLKKEHTQKAKRALALLKAQGGNSAGIKIGAVDNYGNVYPDQFLRNHPLGNINREKFSQVWRDRDNLFLNNLRNRKVFLKGRCSRCNFLSICNGNFRARAETITGDIWAEDPGCYLTEEEIKEQIH